MGAAEAFLAIDPESMVGSFVAVDFNSNRGLLVALVFGYLQLLKIVFQIEIGPSVNVVVKIFRCKSLDFPGLFPSGYFWKGKGFPSRTISPLGSYYPRTQT